MGRGEGPEASKKLLAGPRPPPPLRDGVWIRLKKGPDSHLPRFHPHPSQRHPVRKPHRAAYHPAAKGFATLPTGAGTGMSRNQGAFEFDSGKKYGEKTTTTKREGACVRTRRFRFGRGKSGILNVHASSIIVQFYVLCPEGWFCGYFVEDVYVYIWPNHC